ncbi:MAG: RNA-directed DNA polymerase [Desulfocapsaceae bacterium]|nr:RNA-directed DNA polymerase [Desulfocapsaceae bacterium]
MSKNDRLVIKKNDYDRVLITETIPYEVPFLFNNIGFYLRIKREDLKKMPSTLGSELAKIMKSNSEIYTIPYTYKIKKNSKSYRELGVIHPFAQIKFTDFYKKYATLILSLCSKSNFSLRYPEDIANYYYEKALSKSEIFLSVGNVEFDREGFKQQYEGASSFYKYAKYDFLYKFYESYEFHRLERKFLYLKRFDISKCFYHIYTHTVSWAIKDKRFAKNNTFKNGPFDMVFDSLMQKCNYNETNGIIVGPEVSRIFAEIILQSIDIEIQKCLEDKDIRISKDYSIRRYIDDYFVFYNDNSVVGTIERTIVEKLSHYKLFLNDAKEQTLSRPFTTGETAAKSEIARLLERLFSSVINLETLKKHSKSIGNNSNGTGLIKENWNKSRLSNSFIRDLKAIVHKNGIQFDSVVNYVLSSILKVLAKVIINARKKSDPIEIRDLSKLTILFVEVCFFVYCMCPRVRSTYLISQLIFIIKGFYNESLKQETEVIFKSIFDEIVISFDVLKKINKESKIEIQNLLIVSKVLGKKYLLNEGYIADLFEINMDKPSASSLGYFDIVSLLHYIGKNKEYKIIRRLLYDVSMEKIIADNFSLEESEKILLFFDLIACPYIRKSEKSNLIAKAMSFVFQTEESLNKNKNKIYKLLDGEDWFFNWRGAENNLGQLLIKKELRTAY